MYIVYMYIRAAETCSKFECGHSKLFDCTPPGALFEYLFCNTLMLHPKLIKIKTPRRLEAALTSDTSDELTRYVSLCTLENMVTVPAR